MKDTVLSESIAPGLVRIKLNRPETGNCYDDEMVVTLITAFDEVAEDSSVKLVWLTSAGEHFSSGPSDAWIKRRVQSSRAEHQHDAEQLARLFDTVYQFPIPIVATVRGQSNAAAVGLLCCCDIVLGCERSTFTITETEFGQVPALQSPYLIKAIGERAARYYSLSSETMDAYTASRLGLVNKIIPSDELDTMTDMMIEKMLRKSSLSLRQTKAMITLSANEAFDESLIETLVDCSTEIRVSQAKEKTKVTS